MAQRFSKPFYNSRQWQQVRDYILKRDKYLCVQCGNPAEEVHHKTKLTPQNITDPMISIHEDNLVSLCRDCHFKEHKRDRPKASEVDYQYYFDETGQLQKAPPTHEGP